MKKLFALFFAVITVFSFTSCGNNDISEEFFEESNASAESPEIPETPIIPEKTLLFNQNGVQVKFLELTYNGEADEWNVLFEIINNSDEKISLEYEWALALNGFTATPNPTSYWGIECEPHSAIEALEAFENDGLLNTAMTGELNTVSSFSILFSVYFKESDSYFYNEPFVFPIKPLETDFGTWISSSDFTPLIKRADISVFENELCKLTCIGIGFDYEGFSPHPQIFFLLENKTNYYASLIFDPEYEWTSIDKDSVGESFQFTVNGEPCDYAYVNSIAFPKTSQVFAVPVSVSDPGAISFCEMPFLVSLYDSYYPENDSLGHFTFAANFNFD